MFTFDPSQEKSIKFISQIHKDVHQHVDDNVIQILLANEYRSKSKDKYKEFQDLELLTVNSSTGEGVEAAYLNVIEQIIKQNHQETTELK